MTLSDILSRDISLELHEAIALMRAIADSSATLAPSSAPELGDVELLRDGSVRLLGSVSVDDPVRSLIEMLQVLIGPAAGAPQLASLMEQPYDSVAAFSQDLAYFERPNRSLILQDLYARAGGESSVPALPAADELMASLRATPVPDATDQGETKPQPEAQRRRLMYVAALLAAVAVSAVVFVFLWRGRAASIAGAPPTLTSRVADGVTSVAGAVGSAVKSIGERTGLASAPPPPPVEAAAPPIQNGTGAGSAPARGSSKTPISTSKGSPSSTLPVPGPGGTAVQGRITDRPLPAPAATPAEPDADIGDMVYTARSPNVVPPQGVRPHVPKELPAGTKPEDITRIEIVIDPQGTVASVKLVGQPRMNDAMLLSAAKAWRFRPANRNGTPVSYRMTVSVAR